MDNKQIATALAVAAVPYIDLTDKARIHADVVALYNDILTTLEGSVDYGDNTTSIHKFD